MDTEKEKEYFLVSVRNLFTLADKQYCPKFSAFMTEEEQALAQPLAAKLSRNTGMEIRFWGGYEGAVRVMLGVFPEGFPVETEDFPIVGYTARCRASDKLEHRALLGSLMAQQIRREMLGDLIPGTGSAVIFADERIEKVLATQIDRIGTIGVRMEKGFEPIDTSQRFVEVRGTLMSLRLDAAVALLAGTGREKAARMIREGLVSVGHVEEKDVSRKLKEGDVLVIRHTGKFRLRETGGLTKRGRTVVLFDQYI
ncbi:MAG TPA: hypothetical protein IAC43_04930 [Candidatus Faecivivens stercoripullorum]|uniref:RNA-binding S4 domain-containing protein n=1 Tax=Candidatus Faecivivens stercoripullorum TaxID=2840805 RepID=A0A9D1H7I4_9FIRM|nr:hypothetical protein [Candidatus Faecivivens stercoripullorum]